MVENTRVANTGKGGFVGKDVRIVGKRIKNIKRLENREDVYCLASDQNGTMIANGIITRQCDALRYCIATHKVAKYYDDRSSFGRTLGFR